MDKKLLKEEYKRLLTKAIEGRPGGMALMIVLEETDFYNSPASAKHHLNVPGGLVLHSLNVARTALELCENARRNAGRWGGAALSGAALPGYPVQVMQTGGCIPAVFRRSPSSGQ